MIYLILAILSSVCIAVLMRILDPHIKNNMAMFTANYIVCEILSLFFLFTEKGSGALALSDNTKGLSFAIILGHLSGILYLVSFVLLQFNIRKNGIIMAELFMKLGVIVPVLMAIIFFKDGCTITQIIGFVLALIAIIVINTSIKPASGNTCNPTGTLSSDKPIADSSVKGSFLFLILLLLIGGLTDSTSNIFDELGNADLKNHFLIFIFVAAILSSLVMTFVKKQKFTRKDFLCGIAIGIPNYFSSRFLLYSLSDVPAIIAYPVFNIAAILLITIIGVLGFKEKLNSRKIIGLVLIAAAIVALNLKFTN